MRKGGGEEYENGAETRRVAEKRVIGESVGRESSNRKTRRKRKERRRRRNSAEARGATGREVVAE